MPVHFEAASSDGEFTSASDPPWMMVPLDKNREVEIDLVEGAGYAVSCEPSWVRAREVTAQGQRRKLVVTGLDVGQSVVHAKKGADILSFVFQVMEKRPVNVAFFFVSDTAKHRSTRPQGVKQLIQDANDVLGRQTNVWLANPYSTEPVAIAMDLGDPCSFNDDERLLKLFEKRNPNAHFNVFFVWRIADDNAVTFRGRKTCVMQDDVGGKDGQVLAHETGHLLIRSGDHVKLGLTETNAAGYDGHSPDRNLLMYSYSDVGGTRITQAQAVYINAAAGKL